MNYIELKQAKLRTDIIRRRVRKERYPICQKGQGIL